MGSVLGIWYPNEGETVRQIFGHDVPGTSTVEIFVADVPSAGGANHVYRVGEIASVVFQNGPIAENGVNGVTQEILLAICADRLRSFQAGPYACRENALALTKIEEALHWLHARTTTRVLRGVEGTSEK